MTDPFKQALRQTQQQIRKNLTRTYCAEASKAVFGHIRKLESYRYAKRIALYQAINGEVSLDRIWQSAPLQGKYCYFPALNDDHTLSFLPATLATPFSKNRFGIAEPSVKRSLAIQPNELDIIFMPLVAFDERGTRLGMGAGYYDRTLANYTNSMLIGVAYEFQRQTFIHAEPWDIPLNIIVTEQNIYWSHL